MLRDHYKLPSKKHLEPREATIKQKIEQELDIDY